jgi:hypothetical protein
MVKAWGLKLTVILTNYAASCDVAYSKNTCTRVAIVTLLRDRTGGGLISAYR